METFSMQKTVILCCVIVLMTTANGVSKYLMEGDREKQKSEDSKDFALVAIDSEDSDKTDEVASRESFINKNIEIFKPTHEWQTVKEGQAVPSGLHIRLNLQTGLREAKLLDDDNSFKFNHHRSPSVEETNQPTRHEQLKQAMEEAMKDLESGKTDDNESEMKYWKENEREGMINKRNPSFSHGELKQALKKFKSEKDDVQDPKVKAESSKNGFRSIDEIREDFRKLHVDMKTDVEIITDIMKKYRNKDIRNEERVALLNDIEYYVHQIDNAQNFADMGGIGLVIEDLNSTSEDVRSEAAFVLASALQSNPKVQVDAVENGAMQKLIRMLSTEESTTLRTRVLSAISSLIRNFPFAQLKFLKLGGLDALSMLMKQQKLSEKLCIKAVTLVNDLLMEKISTENDLHVSPSLRSEKLNQYSRVPVLESVIELGWCGLVPKLLDFSDLDSQEKVLSAMWTLRESCQSDFAHALPKLKLLRQKYSELSQRELEENGTEDGDTYFTSVLLHDVSQLLDHISRRYDDL